jgi:hypothetical protein
MAAAATALVAPAAASAKTKVITQCTGGVIDGQGAAVEVGAQTIWTAQFDATSSNKNIYACDGNPGQGNESKTEGVTYISTSSGKGLESWGDGGSLVSDPPGNDGFGLNNAFIGTEEAPDASPQISDIEAQETSPASPAATVLSFPVGQEAITVLVHLPKGCTGASASYPAPSGRLVFNNVTLESIFRGVSTTWASLKDDGDTVTCSVPAEANDEISRVVREDPAGTTHILKRYLDLINSTAVDGSETWNDLSQGSQNTVWPSGSTLHVPSKSGDSAEIKEVATVESSIGYGGLSDVRTATGFPFTPKGSGGPGTALFWAPIQDNGVGDTGISKGKYSEKYADPATNGDENEKGAANCTDEKYTNGVSNAKFPPSNVDLEWATVTTATKEKAYSLCGITFIEALGDYNAFNSPATVGEAQTVHDYLQYVLSDAAEGGQTFLDANDYEELPAKLDKESVKDLTEIKQT